MQRIVVAVDPSGCSGPEDFRSDEIGIVVVGKGTDGRGYMLEDRSGRFSPEGWAKETIKAFDDWHADKIIGEKNYGGSMVETVIKTARKNAPVKLVTATRGKVRRAEPVAALYEQGKISHMIDHEGEGDLLLLEDQLCNFSQSGYQGSKSPDRADAGIWGLTELMIGGSTYDSSLNWVG